MSDDLISRAAALKGLEDLNIASFYEENEHSKEAYTEVKAMLKALPPAQPGCEDTVYRKAVQMLLAYFVPEERYAEAVDGLRRLPSAQPERKGKWVGVGYDGDWLKTMCKCSKCGAMIDINEKYRNFFCYHCGARMDGEQDG